MNEVMHQSAWNGAGAQNIGGECRLPLDTSAPASPTNPGPTDFLKCPSDHPPTHLLRGLGSSRFKSMLTSQVPGGLACCLLCLSLLLKVQPSRMCLSSGPLHMLSPHWGHPSPVLQAGSLDPAFEVQLRCPSLSKAFLPLILSLPRVGSRGWHGREHTA